MRHLKFLQFVLALTLCACTSCEEEDKLPGTKPDILLGEWEHLENVGIIIPDYYLETYTFTKTGGSINQKRYFPDEERYEEYYTGYFTDWSYDGQNIYFIYKKNGYTNPWDKPISDLTSESFKLGSYTYYRKSDN